MVSTWPQGGPATGGRWLAWPRHSTVSSGPKDFLTGDMSTIESQWAKKQDCSSRLVVAKTVLLVRPFRQKKQRSISGLLVAISGYFVAISGLLVAISGLLVDISGLLVAISGLLVAKINHLRGSLGSSLGTDVATSSSSPPISSAS